MQDVSVPNREVWSNALSHMEEALCLLDKVETPVEIAAYLDLAINRLKGALEDDQDFSA